MVAINRYEVPVKMIVYADHLGQARAMANLVKNQPYGHRLELELGEPQLLESGVADPQEAAREAARALMERRSNSLYERVDPVE